MKSTVALLAMTVLSAALRLFQLGRDSLWFDEAVSCLASALPLPQILNNTIQSSHPPLYYLLLSGWRALLPVDGDAALRGVSVLAGTLTVPAMYLLSKSLFKRERTALFSAFLIAVSPFHLLYSQELRMYTLVTLLVTLLAWTYLEALRHGRLRWWLAFVVLGIAALYTHLFAALPLAAIGLHALLGRQERASLWRTAIAGAFIVVAFIPWGTTLVQDVGQQAGSLRPLLQDNVFNPIKPLTSPTFLLFGLSNNLLYSGLAFFLTLALATVLVLDVNKARRAGEEIAALTLPLLVVLLTLGAPLAVYLVRPFFLPERTMAGAAPFLLLLLAWGATRRGSPLPYLAYGALFVMLAGSLLYLLGPPLKPPYREAIALLAQHRQPGDAVLHTSDGSYLPALCYVNWPNHALLAGDPDPRKPTAVYRAVGGTVWEQDSIAAENGRLWLVVALEHSHKWQESQLADLNARYRLVDQFDIDGIHLYRYDTETP